MIKTSNKKVIAEYVKTLEAQGWRVEKNKHYKAFSPDGKHLVTFASTPGDYRALFKIRSILRRYGANIK